MPERNMPEMSLRPRPGESAEDVVERVTQAAKMSTWPDDFDPNVPADDEESGWIGPPIGAEDDDDDPAWD